MSPAERMAGIDDLFETAIAMRRARFVREHPRATPQEVDAAVDAWLLERELESRLDERRIEGARRAAFLTRTEPR
jgi:hypothetical protein